MVREDYAEDEKGLSRDFINPPQKKVKEQFK